jgi:hypothetical protein
MAPEKNVRLNPEDPGDDGAQNQAFESAKVADLCRELGVTRQTLYRHVSPAGNLREDGRKLLKTKRRELTPD